MGKLTGKIAVVTGAAKGIGAAAVERFLADDVELVALVDMNLEMAQETAKTLDPTGKRAFAFRCNVADPYDVERCFGEIEEKFGRVDILVNNAGTGGQPKKLIDMDADYFDHYVEADYKALYFMSQAAAKQMAAQGCEKGTHPYRIINLSSAAGIKSPIGDTVYGSLKAAVTHLSKIMANELARYGVTVNAVAPGYVLTDMTKDVMADEKNVAAVTRMISLRRYAQPIEIASVITFLATPAGGYITGVLIPVDGGMTIN